MRLQDKVVVITGSTRGIGRSIALACASEGASVVVSSRSPDSVQRLVEEMKALGYAVAGTTCDATVPGALTSLSMSMSEKPCCTMGGVANAITAAVARANPVPGRRCMPPPKPQSRV